MKLMKQKIEWRPRSAFGGRSVSISSSDGVIYSDPIPDNLIVCDMCNDEIKEDPVAVIRANAVCKKCRGKK